MSADIYYILYTIKVLHPCQQLRTLDFFLKYYEFPSSYSRAHSRIVLVFLQADGNSKLPASIRHEAPAEESVHETVFLGHSW